MMSENDSSKMGKQRLEPSRWAPAGGDEKPTERSKRSSGATAKSAKERHHRFRRARGGPDEETPRDSLPPPVVHKVKIEPKIELMEVAPSPDYPIHESPTAEPRLVNVNEAEKLPHATPVGPTIVENRKSVVGGAGPVAIATKFGAMDIDWKSKKVRWFLLLALVVVCGAVVGVVVALVNNKSSDSDPIVGTSSPPTPLPTPGPGTPTSSPTGDSTTSAPTSIVLEQIGQELFEETGGTMTGPRGERYFGWTVDMSMDGDRLAVSLPYCPCVYIYDFISEDSTWVRTGIVSDGPGILDHVALSGDGKMIVIGMPAGTDEVDEMGGRVQVFEETTLGSWRRLGHPLYGQSSTDHLGGFVDDDEFRHEEYYEDIVLSRQSYDSRTLALSENGRTLALGSPRGNYVRVLRYDEETMLWRTLGEDEFLLGEEAGDEFGNSVDLSADGTRIIVGSPGNIGNAHPNFFIYNGLVRVFQYIEEDGRWKKIGQDLKGARGQYSSGVQEGSTVTISADGSTIGTGGNLQGESEDIWGLGQDDGHARIFSYSGSRDEWIQQGNTINVFQFGLTFVYSDQAFHQLSVALNSEKFPIVTRLSGDGKRVVISSPSESLDGEFTGRGVVRLYELRGEVWVSVGDPIEGSEDFDQSGRSLALSFDGSRLAIGSPVHNGVGMDQGQVRLFNVRGRAETNAPGTTLAPTVTADPTLEPVAISVRLRFGRYSNVDWKFECGETELASFFEESKDSDNYTSVVETFMVEPEVACSLTFGAVSDVEYMVFYGDDTSDEDLLLFEGVSGESYLRQPKVFFIATDKLVSVSVAVKLDNFPSETGWTLWCDDILYRHIITGTFMNENDYINVTVNGIEEGAMCEFEITDSFGDGLCCGDAGPGFFSIYIGDNVEDDTSLLVIGNGEFGNSDVVAFVASANQDVVTSSPTGPAPPTPALTMPPTQSPLTQDPATGFPTVSLLSLVPITLEIDLNYDPERIGWRLQCGHQIVSQVPVGFYTVPDIRISEILMAEDKGECVFFILDAHHQGVSFRIYYGEDTTDNDMLILAGRRFDYLQIIPFIVSHSVDPITPSPTYVTDSPTVTPFPTFSPSESPAPTSEGAVFITVTLQLDSYPEETGWLLVCGGMLVIDVPEDSYAVDGELVEENYTVQTGAECQATATDSFGDGILDGGYFQISLASSLQVLARIEGSEFTSEAKVTFTVP